VPSRVLKSNIPNTASSKLHPPPPSPQEFKKVEQKTCEMILLFHWHKTFGMEGNQSDSFLDVCHVDNPQQPLVGFSHLRFTVQFTVRTNRWILLSLGFVVGDQVLYSLTKLHHSSNPI